jgi:ATP-dependent helicase HepA
LFDHLGLDVSDHSHRGYHFHRGQRHSEAFADLPEEGLSATFDRETALAREDLAFLTADHPVLLGALEHFLDSESGNASFGHWKTGEGKGLLLDCAFVLEVIAPTRLHLDRFLPPTVIRVVVDHQGNVFSGNLPSAVLTPGDSRRLVGQETFRRDLFPKMLAAAQSLANAASDAPAKSAGQLAAATLNAELARLEDLATRNRQVSPTELAALRATRDETLGALVSPRLRLDAIRLVWRT